MKKLVPLLFSFIITLSPLSLFPQDGWINQLKQINAGMFDIHSPGDITNGDGFNYWMVGDSGTVLKSNGFPNAWSQQESGIHQNLRGVYFFLDGTGYCVGDSGTCIRSGNFGNHWNTIPVNTSADLHDIWFINDTTGFIVGDSGILLESHDRGLNWISGNLNSFHNLNRIRQLTSSLAWIVGDSGTIFRTIDGGKNWQAVNTGFTGDFNDIYFPDDECAYIVGDNGLVIKTEDSGVTWQEMSIPVTSDLYSVACTDCYNLWVCGDQGSLYYRTSDDTAWNAYTGETGGLNFHSIMLMPDDGYFCFLADSGSYIILLYYNTTSSLNKAGHNQIFNDIEFIDAVTGYIAGNFATLLHTSDGGKNWFSLHLGDFQDQFCPQIYDVDFVDSLHGYALANGSSYTEHGYVFSTADGGMTWTNLFYSTTQSLQCMYFLDGDHGWVGGGHGFVMRTNDGGENWTVVQPANPDLNWVQEIYFYNLQDGYMTRSYGEFLSTSDGGETWELLNSFTGTSEDMFVLNDTIIWLIMNSSGLNKSEDGGASWSNISFPYNNQSATSLFFLNELEGYACGSVNYLWHTTDGGESWVFNSIKVNRVNYRQVIFTDSTNGWMIGMEVIMHGPGLYVDVPEQPGTSSQVLLIYPNPANNMIHIKFEGRDFNSNHTILIYNIIGQEMIKMEISAGSDSFNADVSDYQPGIYFTVIRKEEKIISSGKFIISP